MTEENQDIPAVDGSSPRRTEFSGPPPMVIDVEKSYTAEMVTSMGTMVIHLNPALAPKTVNNYVFHARWQYYDGIKFHRVINGFVVQGGDPQGTGMGGPGYKFEDELPAPGRYELGSLAMANAGPNTNGSHFFIITGPSGQCLPPQYALFGQVVKGLEVADAMQQVSTNHNDRPLDDIVIESVIVTEQAEA